MRPELRLLERQGHLWVDDDAPLLVVDPPDLPTATRFLDNPAAHLWTRHYGVARQIRDRVTFDARWVPPRGRFQRAIIFLPKGRRLQQMTFAQVRGGLTEGDKIYVVGANQAGIKGARSGLTDVVGPVESVDSARRCTLVEATVTGPHTPFSADAWCEQWSIDIGDAPLQLATYPGTFSDGALDEGTRTLLEVLTEGSRPQRVLDLGCGSGVIGATLARLSPQSAVLQTDVNASALASARVTAHLNALTNVTIRASDWYSDVDGRFDAIVCNPPFHQGVATDTSMVDEVIEGAPAFLDPSGALWLVANRFLPYGRRLEAVFEAVHIVRDTPRFRVFRASGVRRTRLAKPARQRSFRSRRSTPFG